MKEAYLYEKLDSLKVRCKLCAHRCLIQNGKRGVCLVRENKEGKLYALTYGHAIAKNVDPIEKKPFFHFLPGSYAFSIATAGCNFRCSFCQNFEISQLIRDGNEIFGENFPPENVVRSAIEYDCQSISYTYTEPTIFAEYAYDSARIAKEKGLKNNFVTNGYMTEETLKFFKGYLDAANVDLKAFTEKFYSEVCGAKLAPVLDSIAEMRHLGIWVEITTLVVPTLNDSPDELREIAKFIKSVGCEIPWHVSRFHPTYRVNDISPTPVETLKMAREIGKEVGLRYVYTGNVPGDEGENTHCYNCGRLLIKRYGFQVLENSITGGKCPKCGTHIDGIFCM